MKTIEKTRKASRSIECPNCNGKMAYETKVCGVIECKKCGAIYGRCYKGDSYSLVLPYMTEEVKGKEVYYDLEVLGSNGIERRHGWFDTLTKMITQVG